VNFTNSQHIPSLILLDKTKDGSKVMSSLCLGGPTVVVVVVFKRPSGCIPRILVRSFMNYSEFIHDQKLNYESSKIIIIHLIHCGDV
jgi:hypothetical protein